MLRSTFLSVTLMMILSIPAIAYASGRNLEFGDCVDFEGKCYRPMKVTVEGDPVRFGKVPGQTQDSLVLWRIDADSGEQVRVEIDASDFATLLGNEEFPLPDTPAPSFKDNNRTKITDTRLYPYSTVLKLFMSVPGTQYGAVCTGMMLSQDVALTAGHCVYSNDASQGIPVGSLNVDYVIPAMDGMAVRPFGYTKPDDIWIPNGWKNPGYNDEFNHDWAVMKLKRNIGENTGWMEVVGTGVSDNYFYNKQIHILGYPGDLDEGNRMYHVSGYVGGIYGNILYHDAYTYQGNSGGPNYFNIGSDEEPEYQIVGIVSHGINYGGQMWNGSTMITPEVASAVREAMDCSGICEEGAKECVNDTYYKECFLNSFGCLGWSKKHYCGNDSTCNNGICTSCEHECEEDETACEDDYTPKTCKTDEQGCRYWQEEDRCDFGQYCTEGACIDETPDGDTPEPPDPDDCRGACVPGDSAICLSDGLSICECKALQWTKTSCVAFCTEKGMSYESCSFHIGLGMDACICNDDTRPLPDGDINPDDEDDDDDDGGSGATGGGGCNGSPLPGSSVLILLLVAGIVMRRFSSAA